MQKNAHDSALREAERYRELVKKSTYTGKDCPHGFVYNPTFSVGEKIYQACDVHTRRQSSRRDKSRSARTWCHPIPRLKLLMPDTLVFNVDDEPQWYYTDKKGYVTCTARFETGQAVEQLGDVRYDGDLTAVRKQSCPVPVTTLRPGDDQDAVYSDGNTLSLANTRDLRVLMGATITIEGHGPPSVADGGEPFVLQKFIKSKGPHAFIVRQVMEHNLLPTAWIISNKQPFGGQGENDPGVKAKDSLLMASPNYIARFITTTKRAMSCCITKIGPGACAETAEVAGRVMHHLETVLEQRLRILVCDFTRDDRGRLWFLQIKAFRFLGCTPRRPFRLTGKALMDARRRLAGGNP
ncbi:unnamed protein product, partial [Sphacelaria rigidula]